MPSEPITPEQLLAYAEGSLPSEEVERIQAAICADAALFEEMVDVRRRIYERLEVPKLESLAEETAGLEAERTPDHAWAALTEWCQAVAAEAVVVAEIVQRSVRALENSWALASAPAARLAASKVLEPLPPAPSEIRLERDGNVLQILPAEAGVKIVLELADERGDRVLVFRPTPQDPSVLERFPGTQTVRPRNRLAVIEVPCEPGSNPIVIEVLAGSLVLHRWACSIRRTE